MYVGLEGGTSNFPYLSRNVIINLRLTMDIKEVSNWAEEVELDIKFLRDQINNIRSQNEEKLKQLSQGVSYYKDELNGLHKLQESKCVAVTDISTYLLKQIANTPRFKECVKRLEDGENIELKVNLRKKYAELPLEILPTGIKGELTKSVEGLRDDIELRERVEKRLKTKEKVKVSEMTGGYTYED